MRVIATSIAGVFMLKPKRFEDARGFFTESYNKRQLAELGIAVEFVQDNLSYSKGRGTLRGLHFQTRPLAQDKLVSVIQGAALDVAVDLRRGSATFGQYVAARLDAAEGNQLFIPVGFAHGFLTLEPDTLFSYKVSNYYSPEHDRGIRWNDATLGIDWGSDPAPAALSDKDGSFPNFDPAADYFPQ
jgi:dTDP-4-dehydrorhamnose 3,5-epimerase